MKFEMPKFDIYAFDMSENIAKLMLDEEDEKIGGKIDNSNIF